MSEGILPVRGDGRQSDELRPVSFVRGFLGYAEGSVLVSFGETKIVCSATVEDKVPAFLRGSGRGWVTAEYGMLPRSTSVRMQGSGQGAGLRQEHGNSATRRQIAQGMRGHECPGGEAVTVDCDVINADGGTRTAAVSGGFVALYDALAFLREKGIFLKSR